MNRRCARMAAHASRSPTTETASAATSGSSVGRGLLTPVACSAIKVLEVSPAKIATITAPMVSKLAGKPSA